LTGRCGGISSPRRQLALVTGLVLVSGHIDVAALVLLVSGLFALWCLREVHGPRIFCRSTGKGGDGSLILGWGLGFLLAAPNILPVMEYAKTGVRMSERFNGIRNVRPWAWRRCRRWCFRTCMDQPKRQFPAVPGGPRESAGKFSGGLCRSAGHTAGGPFGVVQPAAPLAEFILAVAGGFGPELVPGFAGGG
jgi:hypothetical protein